MGQEPALRRARYRLRKSLGLCINCGRPASLGIVRCAGCNLKKQHWDRAFRQRNQERLIEKQRTLIAQWRKENRCARCGAPLIEDEVDYCMACKAGRKQPVIRGA